MSSHPVCSHQRAISRGFTLVELMVAVVILATGLLLVIEGMARSQQGMRVGENLIAAHQLAEEQLARTEIDLHQTHKLSAGTQSGREALPGKVFRWKKDVEVYEDPTLEDETKLNRVSISVGWREGAHRDNELQLESLLMNREKEK